MPLFSVILPTFNHCDPIIWAIKSVQQQTLQDFEIIVAGDGVPDRTREIMAGICATDSRVRFFDNPKGEAKGERHRHAAVMAANGSYIAYIADDDLWHCSHLEVLLAGLGQADFCNTLHGCVFPDNKLSIFPGDIAYKFCRDVLTHYKHNFFGPTCVCHSKASYLKLPDGWTPAPRGLWSDLHMWRQWFRQDSLRFLTIPQLTTIHLDSPGRDAMSVEERTRESQDWLEKIHQPGAMETLEVAALRRLALEQGCYQFAMRLFQTQLDSQKR